VEHKVPQLGMSERRMRAMLIAFAECVNGMFNPHPNEVWLCNPQLPSDINKYRIPRICDVTKLAITSTYNNDEDYTCMKCNKTYYECKDCWCERHTSANPNRIPLMRDFSDFCVHCNCALIMCHRCIHGLDKDTSSISQIALTTNWNKMLNEISCGICGHVVCQSHLITRSCEVCQCLVRVCYPKHPQNDDGFAGGPRCVAHR
jgi:hypothetical protein